MNTSAYAQAADNDPVILAIDAAVQSLRQQPNQFNLQITAIGAMGVANNGGTGISVTATGGGPNSTTTGMVARVDSGQINIARANADAVLKQQAEQAIQLLNDIKASLQAKTVDKPSVMSKLAQLGQTYIAPVVQTVIAALIQKKLGL